MSYTNLASKEVLEKVSLSLKENGMSVMIVETGEEAKSKLLEMIPAGSSVMNMTSVTLDTISVSTAVNENKKFDPVRAKLSDKEISKDRKRELGAAPQWTIGSVHALTEDGVLIIASNTGSQLPSYAYGAEHVIFVVSSQKIVKDLDEGMLRVYEHVLPLESDRAKKAYGVPGSFVSKLLIINREVQNDRITVIIVNEKLGF